MTLSRIPSTQLRHPPHVGEQLTSERRQIECMTQHQLTLGLWRHGQQFSIGVGSGTGTQCRYPALKVAAPARERRAIGLEFKSLPLSAGVAIAPMHQPLMARLKGLLSCQYRLQ